MSAARVECLREFTAKELEFVANFKSGELNVEAGTSILLQGTNSAHLYTVLSGWAFRYKTLAGRPAADPELTRCRPICSACKARSTTRCSIRSKRLTDMMLCVFPREKLVGPVHRLSDARFDVTWLAAREEQILDEDCSASAGARRSSGWPICC
jgi:hypothetical protein